MTATHLIWEAAGRPGVTMGTRNVREVPLHHRQTPLPCFWCGHEAAAGTAIRVGGLSWRHFTNWDLARRQDSGWLCGACLFAFKDRSLRFGHWVASPAELVRIERDSPAIRRFLLEPPATPFAIGVCQPGETKHMAIRARVNHDRERFWVQFGDEAVWMNRAVLQRWAASLAEILSAGAHPNEVRLGRYRDAFADAGRYRNRAFDLFLTAFLAGGGASGLPPCEPEKEDA